MASQRDRAMSGSGERARWFVAAATAAHLALGTMMLSVSTAAIQAAELQTFSNSPGFTEVLGLNDQGMLFGRREQGSDGVLSFVPYVRHQGIDRAVPISAGFTHLDIVALSGTGRVVAYVMREPGHPDGNQRAVVWSWDQPECEILPVPRGFRDTTACDISVDGSTISGIAIGRQPPRILPCVWQRRGDTWQVEVLDAAYGDNLLLSSARVAVSDNGCVLAGSLVTSISASGVRGYGLFLWERTAMDQPWRPRQIGEHALHLGDVNDAGLVAGRTLRQGKRIACVYLPDRAEPVLLLPAGRDTSYATGVNNQGQVVGTAEDPRGPEGTTYAFAWQAGRFLALPWPQNTLASSANAISAGGRVGGMIERMQSDGRSRVEAFVYPLADAVSE